MCMVFTFGKNLVVLLCDRFVFARTYVWSLVEEVKFPSEISEFHSA